MSPKDALKHAVSLCGGQINFAKRLTEQLAIRGELRAVSQQNVSYWLNSLYGIPQAYCPDVEALLDNKVTRHQLRPDKFSAVPYVPVDDIAA